MSQSEEPIEIEYSGENAKKLKSLATQTGWKVDQIGNMVSCALSVLSTLMDFADNEGKITIVSKGLTYKIRLPVNRFTNAAITLP